VSARPMLSAVEAVCELDTTPVSTVRQLVRDLLYGQAGLAVEDAVLVVDELASNARQHGRAPRICRLALTNQDRRLRVEVEDTAPQQPRIRTPDHTGGRGLRLVDRLATAWGVYRHDRSKTVWAELALDRRGQHGRTPHLGVAPA
jgi:anti-sigma regulatory factor (Ser/Thr protein kinase)